CQVHRHVAAKNGVEGLSKPKRTVFLDEIALLARDHRLNTVLQLEVASGRAKVFQSQLVKSFSEGPQGIPTPHGLLHRQRADIKGEDLDVPGRKARELLTQKNCDRIWLFPGGTSSRQDSQPVVVAASFNPARNHDVGECAEMLRVSEKIRLTYGQLFGERADLFPFTGRREDPSAV